MCIATFVTFMLRLFTRRVSLDTVFFVLFCFLVLVFLFGNYSFIGFEALALTGSQ